MAIAIVGLVGAALGALITLFGGILTEQRQARRDEVTWRRDKRAEAYNGALLHMLRAANLRSEFLGGSGKAVLKAEHQRDFFEDLVQAQYWLRTAARYTSGTELSALRAVTEVLDAHITRLVSGVRFDEKDFSIWEVLQKCILALSGSSSDLAVHMLSAADAGTSQRKTEIIDVGAGSADQQFTQIIMSGDGAEASGIIGANILVTPNEQAPDDSTGT